MSWTNQGKDWDSLVNWDGFLSQQKMKKGVASMTFLFILVGVGRNGVVFRDELFSIQRLKIYSDSLLCSKTKLSI